MSTIRIMQAAKPFMLLIAVSGPILILPSIAAAQTEPGALKPKIEIIPPLSVVPMITTAPFNEGGPASHRRVVSRPKDNAVYLDIGYNTYKAGLHATTKVKYAYSTDEYCYIPSGEAQSSSEGVVEHGYPGTFKWRPAGAYSDSVAFFKDTVTICAMAPARVDEWSHKLAPEVVGKWSGDAVIKPAVHSYVVTNIPALALTGPEFASGMVVEHQVLSRQKDGPTKIDVTYLEFKAGAHLTVGRMAGAQVCWLETGEMQVTSDGAEEVLKQSDFLYRPEGAVIDGLKATKASKLLCFRGPAQI